MAKIAAVADVHIANHRRWAGAADAGINQRCADVLAALDRAIAVADAEKADIFIVLGDLFDTTTPTPQVLARVQRCFRVTQRPFLILLGNHDMVSDARGDHACGPLDSAPHVMVVGVPTSLMLDEAHQLLMVPFRPGPAHEWIAAAIVEAGRETVQAMKKVRHRTLCLHLGIENEDTPPFLRGAPDSIKATELLTLMERYGIDDVLAGNWHNRLVVETKDRRIVQVGTLAPTGWDNPSACGVKGVVEGRDGYGGLAILDTAVPILASTIPGPRFLTSHYPDPTDKILRRITPEMAEQGWRFYIRREVEQPEEVAVDQAALRAAQDAGLIAGFEVTLDRSEIEMNLRRAASEAKRAGSVDEAVARYCGRVPEPGAGLTRADVLECTTRYLKE